MIVARGTLIATEPVQVYIFRDNEDITVGLIDTADSISTTEKRMMSWKTLLVG